MAQPGFTLDAKRLGRHARALRRLAFALVRDDDQAEDLVQETWMATLRSPPDPDRPLRPWLFEVLRNLARAGHRADTRRRRREQAFTAEAEAEAPSPEPALSRAQLARQVAELVMALDEPLRSTVILRYVEGRSAIDIARDQNIPAATVRSRALDGLQRIRAELDRRHGGDRRAWRLALLPLAGSGGSPGLARSPLTAATGPLGAGLTAAVLATLAIGASWWLLRSPSPPRPTTAGLERAPGAGGPAGPVAAVNPGSGDARIEGLVRTTDGQPIAGARLVLLSADRPPASERTRVAVSSDSGFVLSGVPPGRYVLSASAPGFTAQTRSGIAVSPGRVLRTELVLAAGGPTLRGRVLDSSRIPVARALVEVLGMGRFLAVTDDAGAFSLTLPPGRHEVRAIAAGFAPGKQGIELASDARTEFFLNPGAVVQGRVVLRGSDRPVGEAAVALLQRQRGFFESPATTSDAGGRFELRDLPAGTYSLLARRGELTGGPARPLELAIAARLPEVVIEVEPGATVAGVVRGEGGAPLAAARVSLGLNGVPGAWIRGQTDAGGRFHLEGVLPGSWWIVATAPGHLDRYRYDVAVPPGGAAGVELALERGRTLQGKVLDERRRPVAGALVKAVTGRNMQMGTVARSGPDGAFRIENVPTGELHLLAVHLERGAGAETPVQVGPQGLSGVVVELARSATISGRVRWQDGAPVAGALVSAIRARGALVRQSTKTGPDGRFEIPAITPGQYIVDARLEVFRYEAGGHAGDNPGRRTLDLTAGQQVQDVALVLARLDRELTGAVFDPDGRALAGAIVTASPLDTQGRPLVDNLVIAAETEQRYRVASGADGTFRIASLPDGPVRITAEDPTSGRRQVTSAPAGTRDLRLQLAR